MVPFLVLVHGALALVALGARGAEQEARERFLQGVSVAGGSLALATFFATPLLDEGWRTLEVTPSGWRLASISVAVAWIVTAVGERSRGGGRVDTVVYTGAASSALYMFAVNAWSVPALLFAAIAALGIAALHDRPSPAIGAVALGTALLGSGLVWRIIDGGGWALPTPMAGIPLGFMAAAGLVFATVPFLAPARDRATLSAIPLALGLSFTTFASVALGTGPVVALVVLAVAFAAVIRVLTHDTVGQRIVAGWVIGVTLSLATATSNPYVVTRAGIAAVLATAALALWPLSLGRAQIERGLLVAFVAITSGFNAVAAAAAHAFARASSTDDLLLAAPWAAIAALLPVALAAGVSLGASLGRTPESEEYSRSGVLASWLLVFLTVVVGVFPYVGETARGRTGGVVLYLVAVLAGVAAARFAPALGAGVRAPAVPSRFVTATDLPWPQAARLAALAVGGVVALATLALTFQGLRFGFL